MAFHPDCSSCPEAQDRSRREARRLQALARLELTDMTPEDEFDHIARLAAHIFEAPIALVSLVDRDRQVFKAVVGLGICETGRELSFCQTDILSRPEVLVVEDATRDPRFRDNPLVTGEPKIRFYAGAPLVTEDGYTIGRLCIIDQKPRPGLDDRGKQLLSDLANLAMDRIERRREEKRRAAGDRRFACFARASSNAVVCIDGTGAITEWNGAAERMFGCGGHDAIGRNLESVLPGISRLWSPRRGEPALTAGPSVELTAARSDGTSFPAEVTISAWKDFEGKAYGVIIKDVTDRKGAEDRLYRMAHYDALTGLGNRTLFQQRVQHGVEARAPGALLMIDLDGFKVVNDCYGHEAGDAVLREAAHRIASAAGSADDVFRLGGDEFGVVLPVCDPDAVADPASRIVDAFEKPFPLSYRQVRLGASVGAAFFADSDAATILGDADLALYEAKRNGRGRVAFYAPRMREAVEASQSLLGALAVAFARDELELFLQPQVDMRTRAITGAEALLRWRHPERGLLAPGAFIAELETSPIAAEVGAWILAEACRQTARLRARTGLDLRIGVNLFAEQLKRGDLPAVVARTLAASGLPAHALELEITETIILDQDDLIIPQLRRIRALGVGIAFDDYGTGWASLSLLKRYPLTRLKIDRSFVRHASTDEGDAAIVKAVLALGASLGLEVIAEGIEDAAQERFLLGEGCVSGQGFLYGKPMPVSSLERRLLATNAGEAQTRKEAV